MSKYSIILPVRNGGEYLRECINSILAQTLTDFDFIILENCSTDNTLQIVSSYDDKRIKVFSSSLPLSMEDNWRRVLDVSKNEFMTLIGHDDLLDSTYLQVMDVLISRYPDATLFQSHFRYIDSDGKEIGNVPVESLRPDMGAGIGVDQLCRDANAIARLAHAAFQNIADAERAPDLRHLNGFTLEGKG